MEPIVTLFLVPIIALVVFALCWCLSIKKAQSADEESTSQSQPTNHTHPSQLSTNQSPPGYLSSTKPYIVEDDLPPSYFEALSSCKPSYASTVINVEPEDNLAAGGGDGSHHY